MDHTGVPKGSHRCTKGVTHMYQRGHTQWTHTYLCTLASTLPWGGEGGGGGGETIQCKQPIHTYPHSTYTYPHSTYTCTHTAHTHTHTAHTHTHILLVLYHLNQDFDLAHYFLVPKGLKGYAMCVHKNACKYDDLEEGGGEGKSRDGGEVRGRAGMVGR